VRVKSIGWRTELRLRELEGSEVIAGADQIVVRTPENPGFRWGNCVILPELPRPGEAGLALERFREAFPQAAHVAVGIDSSPVRPKAAAEMAALGLGSDLSTVLTAEQLRPPAKRAPQAELRALEGDRDWRAALELSLASEEPGDAESHRAYLELRIATRRRVCEAGHGAWFGAFSGREMHAGLGIFRTAEGLARFQDVDTHRDHRRQGLASHLLLAAGHYAHQQLGAATLVIAADPDYQAIGLYRSLGFVDREQYMTFEALPAEG
jgi:ribosomal protein S18 acetylase RimI-like enzyme